MNRHVLKLIGYSLILFPSSWIVAAPTTPSHCLENCWRRQVKPLKSKYVKISYRETINELEHNFVPWQTTAYSSRGTIWNDADNFLKQDTLIAVGKPRTYFSSTQRSATNLIYRDYGDSNLFAATQGMQQDFVFRAARYSPLSLLSYFYKRHISADTIAPPGLVSYHVTINQTIVRIFIRQKDNLLAQVNLLNCDEMLGDVTTTFRYEGYAHIGQLIYPTHIQVDKYNEHVREDVQLLEVTVQDIAPNLLVAPIGYQLLPSEKIKPNVHVETYLPHLHFVELKHTNDRALVVEFDQFLLIAEAPLSSYNGELIIQAAQQLAPGKPIRYFVAGHHHPHYLGGLRPFVYRGATVLIGVGDEAYVHYLVTSPHTLQPDSLQLHPRPLQVEEILHTKIIADAHFEMQIFCIGTQSAHTNDYLLYYFPSEKLLFEDDLATIPQQGQVRWASARQIGLYQAIKVLHLEVKTIVQSWPVTTSGVKTIIPFNELEQSMTK